MRKHSNAPTGAGTALRVFGRLRWRACAAFCATAALSAGLASAQTTTTTYTYDDLGRVKSAARSGGGTVTYTYDQAGNRTQRVEISPPPPQPPVAVGDSISTYGGTAHTFDPRANDTDPNNDPLTITAKTNGASGTVVINGGVSLTYTSNTGYKGPDAFTYTVSDGSLTAVGNVSVTVLNNAPVANNDSITAATATPYTFDPRPNDTDADNDPLTITATTNGASGSVAINGGSSVTYTSDAGFRGNDSFTYTISDGAATSTAAVSVLVPNVAPTAVNDSYTTPRYATVTIDPRLNDYDGNGEAITIQSVGAPVKGFANLSNGVIQYQPLNICCGANPTITWFTGADSFMYTITDGALTATATVNIWVDPMTIFSVSDANDTEGQGLTFTVTRGGGMALTQSVQYSTANGSATDGSDFYGVSNTFVFAPNETSKTFTVSTIDDGSYEGDETLSVQLTPVSPAGAGDTTGIGTIVDNEFTWITIANFISVLPAYQNRYYCYEEGDVNIPYWRYTCILHSGGTVWLQEISAAPYEYWADGYQGYLEVRSDYLPP
jgi:YD repeat-containing protein